MRRIVPRLAAAVLIVVFIVFFPQYRAKAETVNGQTVIYTVAGDTFEKLSYDTMPYVLDNKCYLPYTVFSNNFDIVSVYNSQDDILILTLENKTLFYDIGNNKTMESSLKIVDYQAVKINGVIYVPAQYTADYFDLFFTYYPNVPLMRVSSDRSLYSDAYLKNLESKMSAMLDEYTESVQDTQSDNPEKNNEESEYRYVYLAFDDIEAGYADRIMDILSDKKADAAFFLSSTDMTIREDMLRRLYVDGFTVGLSAGDIQEPEPDALVNELNKAGDVYRRVLMLNCRLACVPDGSSSSYFTAEHRQALKDAGYRYWDWTLSAVNESRPDRALSKLENGLSGNAGKVVIHLECTDTTAEILSGLLDYLNQNDFIISKLDDTVPPINFYGDTW